MARLREVQVEAADAQQYHALPNDKARSTVFEVLALVAVAFVSGLANGYNGTVLEGTTPRLRSVSIITSTWQSGCLGGMLSVGGLVGSLACADLAYRISRRSMVIVGETIIIVSVLVFALAPSFEFILLGRAGTGFGVGICGLAKPLIVSELSPPHQRGLLVSLFAVGQSVGLNIFYVTDWLVPTPEAVPWVWRLLVAFGALPAVCVVGFAFITPGTPYWDVPPSHSHSGGKDDAFSLLREMIEEPWPIRRNFYLVLALMLGYNLSGTLIISNYAGDVFAAIGAGDRALPIFIGVVQFLGLVSAALAMDSFGRKPLLLLSCTLTAVCLFAISIVLTYQQPVAAAVGDGATTTLLLVCMVAVEYAVGAGLNPIRIVLSAELMPNRYRSLGMSLGNAVGWGLALISLFLFPILSALANGPAPQFAFFGAVVALLAVLLFFQLPETNGISF